MAEILLGGVARVFPNGVKAVERLDLTVQDGELLALVGPSGCGKSTTLRLIAGLDFPTAGEIRIGGRDVSRVPARERNVAMVFQRVGLFPHRTVFDNIAFGLRLRNKAFGWRRWLRRPLDEAGYNSGGNSTGIAGLVYAAAELLRIESLLQRRPGEMSGGEQQRVALAKALAMQPSAMLLDEPFSQLDAALRRALSDELRQLHLKRRITTVFVTHDQAEALALGDRVAVMKQGAIEQIGSPREIYDRPRTRFVAEFVGEPAMNFWDAKLVEVDGKLNVRWAGEAVALPVEIAEQAKWRNLDGLTGGVRPEDVRILREGFSHEAQSKGNWSSPPGTVSQVAFHGGASVVTVRVDEEETTNKKCSAEWRALVRGREMFQPGERVWLSIDSAKVQWFDRQSGLNLRT